jgi:predicted DNA binding CopG/RHH family protein
MHKYTKDEEKAINAESNAWDANILGSDPKTQRAATPEFEKEIDDALGLQPVTIRLQKDLVAELKVLAKENGIGYQPFVRQVLTQFVAEKKRMAVRHA